jgi:L-ascorbate metabolism protein UlaG (beta-lactamase superfamily)
MKTLEQQRQSCSPVWLALAFLAAAGLASQAAPILAPFPELIAPEGAIYAGFLDLDDWVADPTTADTDLVWSMSGGADLVVRLTSERHLIIQAPNPDWFGDAELALAVCSPAGQCAAQTLSVRIENVPDDPTIERIPTQVADLGKPFAPLDLALFGWDADGSEGLTWSVAAGVPLAARIDGTVLTVIQPTDATRTATWVGSEDVLVTLQDPTGRSTTRAIAYTAAERPVALTFIGNEGFLIQCGDTRVLIDALVNEGVLLTPNERARLHGALPPFDRIDLTLATHAHYDHFDAPTAAEFFANSPETVLISLDESIDKLRTRPEFDAISARLTGMSLQPADRAEFDVADLHVTAFAIGHGLGRSNLAFLLDIGGMRILHLGDAAADLTAQELIAQFDWPSLGIDVALVPYWWLFDDTRVDRVTVGIAPRFVIPMHFQGACPSVTDIETGMAVPIALCHEFETWIVPPRDDDPTAP